MLRTPVLVAMDNLKWVCRVCLQYSEESNSFFDEVEYGDYIMLATIYQKVANVEVVECDDVKPCRICHECTDRLLNAFEFIGAVEKAEIEIENYLNTDIQELDEEEEVLDNASEELDNDVKVISGDVDIQGIEILEEEFQAEPDQMAIDNEVVVAVDVELEEIEQKLCVSECNISPIKVKEKTKSEDTVGSRLSKRMLSSHYMCSICQRSFAKSDTLDRHIKLAHTAITREELEHIATQFNSTAADKQISCSYCPQKFKRRNNYIRHLTTTHSKKEEQLSEEDKELIKTKHNYKRSNCPYCDKNFTQASLIVHIRRHTGENPYQCDQCVMAFPRRQDLVVHQRKHTGEKPHICTICGKSFSRANKLARHMRVHTGERPYKCTKCQRSFAQSNDLKIHMRRHTGEKPYKCSVCMEAFICGAALRSHRKQKNHHSPKDELDDPFANWRVCKREVKVNEADTNSIQLKAEKTIN